MPSSRRADLVVFSDLDGTLLSHHEYDWGPARPALAALRARGVPVVPASSKTRREIERWRERLGLDGPCISENGGALWIPAGWLAARPPGADEVAGWWRIGFGVPYPALRAALPRLAAALGVALVGFGDMTAGDVAARTGLPPADVADAMARDFDEPFAPDRPLTPEEEGRLASLAAAQGLTVTRGGRFHHLLGGCSKGRAARRLIELLGGARSVAVGDADNDLDMLEAADEAIVVARPDGSHAPGLVGALPRARFTGGAGPAGFAEGMAAVLGG